MFFLPNGVGTTFWRKIQANGRPLFSSPKATTPLVSFCVFAKHRASHGRVQDQGQGPKALCLSSNVCVRLFEPAAHTRTRPWRTTLSRLKPHFSLRSDPSEAQECKPRKRKESLFSFLPLFPEQKKEDPRRISFLQAILAYFFSTRHTPTLKGQNPKKEATTPKCSESG